MKFGLPVWYGNISSIEDEIERAASLGFDYVEVSLDYPWPELLGKRDIEKILFTARKEGIEFAFHAPPEGIEIGSPWQELRISSVNFLKNLLKWTKQFKPAYFNFHGDCGETLGADNLVWLSAVLNSSRKSCFELGRFSKKLGIPATFENTPDPIFGLASNNDFILEATGIGLCFDFGHSTIVNKLSRKAVEREDRSPKDWGRTYGKRIRALHLHAVKGLGDHYPFSSGNTELRRQFKQLIKGARAGHTLIEVMKESKGRVRKVSDKTFRNCLETARKWAGGGDTKRNRNIA
ncbi:MAG: TIM barrel protein [archaeon]